MTDLREELERIAERAPSVDVFPDLYARARRSVARTRVLTAAAAVACLALIGALLAATPWSTDAGPRPASDRTVPAIPSRIWAAPEWLTDRDAEDEWTRGQVSDDLAVGQTAAAYLRDGLPVLVGALDGRYHLLDLPDFLGNRWAMAGGLFGNSLGFALSPDGTRLAYGFAHFGSDPESAPRAVGIRVVDLTSGAMREIRLPGDPGIIVTGLRWSPGGTWLAWVGNELRSWMAIGSMTGGTPVSGLVAPGADTSTALPASDLDTLGSDLAVDDEGRATIADRGRLKQTGPAGTAPRPIAATDRAEARALLHSDDADRAAITVEDGVSQMTLATDLLGAGPVARPAPRWPWSPDRWAVSIAALGALLAVASGLLMLAVRRRAKASP